MAKKAMAGEVAKEKKKKAPGKKTIVFLHPDLGIGGAERLVVDAAVGLQKRGHRVVIFTSHCDRNHCFDEARDGTLDVRVRGNSIVPPSILGRFSILCAILRQLHLILQISVLSSELRDIGPDAFFVDQLSAGLPLLHMLLKNPRILFYCHFPDLLLAQGRARWWKRAYRVPFDWLEGFSMGFAAFVAVNSEFTKGVVSRTWPSLGREELKVVYPCVAVPGEGGGKGDTPSSPVEDVSAEWMESVILSINRFERKKNVALAIKAYAGLPKEKRKGSKLVIAGGYDNRVAENVTYHAELEALASKLNLRHATTKTAVTAMDLGRDRDLDVLFLLSVPSFFKNALLRSARLLIYTPADEHFGIVPLEAMLAGVPVLACDSGGPTETVVEDATGWLRSPLEVERWTHVMDNALHGLSEGKRREMRAAGPRRVRENFSDEQMAERLEGIFEEMDATYPRSARELSAVRSGLSKDHAFFLLTTLAIVFVVSCFLGALRSLRS